MADERRPMLPMGLYLLKRIENDGTLPVELKCGECDTVNHTDTPVLELTRTYARIGASCYNCGVSITISHLNVARLLCHPLSVPESM